LQNVLKANLMLAIGVVSTVALDVAVASSDIGDSQPLP